jgi:hypothetical protein
MAADKLKNLVKAGAHDFVYAPTVLICPLQIAQIMMITETEKTH